MKMTSRQILESVDRALSEVDRRLKSGELDGSGRFYSDEEIAAGAASGRVINKSEAARPAAKKPKIQPPDRRLG